MPVNPWVFLSFGRPERRLADAVTAGLWRERIEAYNYLHRPVVDRAFQRVERVTFQSALLSSKLVILILTERSIRAAQSGFRDAVMDEIEMMRDRTIGDRPIVLLSTPGVLEQFPFVEAPQLIDLSHCESPRDASAQIVAVMSEDLLGRCRSSWDTNKTLEPIAWGELNHDLERVDDSSTLPMASSVLAHAFAGVSTAVGIAKDLEGMNHGPHRWFMTVKIGEWVRPFDRDCAQALDLEARRMQDKDPRMLHEPVSPKSYATGERISTVSSLVRGAQRFTGQLERVELPIAQDLSARVDSKTWPHVRALMLCSVYRMARALGEGDLCRSISAELA